MRAGRRREDRRGAVGAVRPVGPGRPPPRLLAGTPGRPHFIDPLGGPVRFVPFELERWQSTWENRVRFNLSESGVHPLSIQELLGLAGASALPLLEVRLGYSQSNGTDLLRSRIAALYPGASPDQILVTTGSAEANFCVCWRLIEPGDTVALMLPNYLQTWGLAQNFGAQVRADGRRDPHGDRAGHETRGRYEPSQPHRPRTVGRDAACPAGAHRGGRRLAARRRSVPGSGARRPDDAVFLGRVRARHRGERAVQGVRAAGAADRLDRRPAGALGGSVGAARLHHHRPSGGERPPRRRSTRAARARAAARAHPPHPQGELPRARGLAEAL